MTHPNETTPIPENRKTRAKFGLLSPYSSTDAGNSSLETSPKRATSFSTTSSVVGVDVVVVVEVVGLRVRTMGSSIGLVVVEEVVVIFLGLRL